jgi:CxxC motif-containing protein (DUF1111 family)
VAALAEVVESLAREMRLLYDLLVHHMGKGLADGITQGAAGHSTILE